MDKCSKCSTDSSFLVQYTNLQEKWGLCHVCDAAFDNKAFLLSEFLKEDFGLFPVNKVQKNMIKARMNRVCGKGAWTNLNGDNKVEPERDDERSKREEPCCQNRQVVCGTLNSRETD